MESTDTHQTQIIMYGKRVIVVEFTNMSVNKSLWHITHKPINTHKKKTKNVESYQQQQRTTTTTMRTVVRSGVAYMWSCTQQSWTCAKSILFICAIPEKTNADAEPTKQRYFHVKIWICFIWVSADNHRYYDWNMHTNVALVFACIAVYINDPRS